MSAKWPSEGLARQECIKWEPPFLALTATQIHNDQLIYNLDAFRAGLMITAVEAQLYRMMKE